MEPFRSSASALARKGQEGEEVEGDPEKLEERGADTLEEERTEDTTTEVTYQEKTIADKLVKGVNKYLKIPWLSEAYEQRQCPRNQDGTNCPLQNTDDGIKRYTSRNEHHIQGRWNTYCQYGQITYNSSISIPRCQQI